MTNSKQQLRKQFQEKRKKLTDVEIQDLSLKIANNTLQIDIWNHATYHTFLTIAHKKEIDTTYLLHILQGKDKNIVVSRSNFEDLSMSHYLLTDQTKLSLNNYGIPEPLEGGIIMDDKNIDVVFVPLLVADQYGNRIGYGKGFYDRFLKKCKPDVIKVGLSFFEPLKDKIITNQEDIALDYLISAERVVKIG
jgi:5-formyltetrahydrofolate cyclo-ligase